jgi:hypothetical protein
VLVGADQGGQGLDADVEAAQPGHFVPLGHRGNMSQTSSSLQPMSCLCSSRRKCSLSFIDASQSVVFRCH